MGVNAPIGLYTYEDDIPGVDSVQIPDNQVTRFARDFWGFAEKLDDMRPGLGDVWRWVNPFD